MTKTNLANGNLRGRLLIIALAVLTFGPFILAWYMAKHPEWVGKTTNYGALIVPPRPIDFADLAADPAMGDAPLAELKHRWVLVQLAPGGRCDAACQDGLYRSKQVWLRLSKDMPRVRRLLAASGGVLDAPTLQAVRRDDETLLIAKVAPGLRQTLEQTASGGVSREASEQSRTGAAEQESQPASGLGAAVWLIDPHGNVMMRYPLDYDPHGLLRDLQHLLKISTSG